MCATYLFVSPFNVNVKNYYILVFNFVGATITHQIFMFLLGIIKQLVITIMS